MTDKEFKRLSRSELIDIIYQLQLQHEELTAAKEALERELADKRLRISNAGSIAEAALEIHNVMRAAQDAAEHYLEEVRLLGDAEYQKILAEAKAEAAAILDAARKEAETFTAKAENPGCDSVLEEILKEYGSDRADTGEGA